MSENNGDKLKQVTAFSVSLGEPLKYGDKEYPTHVVIEVRILPFVSEHLAGGAGINKLWGLLEEHQNSIVAIAKEIRGMEKSKGANLTVPSPDLKVC